MKKEMSEWDSVSNMCNKQLKTGRNRLAPLAIEANINLGKWDQVKSWLPSL